MEDKHSERMKQRFLEFNMAIILDVCNFYLFV